MSCGCELGVIEKNTDCECAGPGFCTRHQCTKPEHFWKLCRDRADYFQLYEEGKGPGQNLPDHAVGRVPPKPQPVLLGDLIGWLAGLVGVKPWPGCGCDKRREFLNRFKVWGWWR